MLARARSARPWPARGPASTSASSGHRTSGTQVASSSSPCLRLLGPEDLGQQELVDVGVLGDHGGHRPLRMLVPGEGPGGEPQSGGPAAQARGEVVDGVGAQGRPAVPQQLGGLVVGEGEVGRPDLHDRVVEAVAVQRQHRVDPACEDQPQASERVVEEVRHLRGQLRGAQLVAVQHEGPPPLRPGDRRGERPQPGPSQQQVGAGPRHGLRAVQAEPGQAVEHRLPEAGVVVLEGDPADGLVRCRTRVQPLGDQGGLAGTRRSAHQHQGSGRGTVQLRHQARPQDVQRRDLRYAAPGRGGRRLPGLGVRQGGSCWIGRHYTLLRR